MYTSLIDFFSLALAFLFSLSFHEWAHAYSSHLLGDPTAKQMGRLTLNPFSHIDITGILFLVFVGIGWGKAVPISDQNLKHPIRDMAIIAFSGPFANIILALITLLFLKYTILPKPLYDFFSLFFSLNCVLAVFNLLPFPPLDGSHIVKLILPSSVRHIWENIQTYGQMYIIIFFLADSYFSLGILEKYIFMASDILSLFLYSLT
jgi:Zn-dependent protease